MKAFITFLFVILVSNVSFSQDAMYEICPIKVSQEVPSAKVFGKDGSTVDLKEYIGQRPVVVVFYRGGWCPYCTRHLSALQNIKSEIQESGYELIAITPDNFSKLDTSVIRSKGFEYQLFSDKEINAIDAFGIGWKVNDKLYNKYKNQYKMDIEWWTGNNKHILPVPSVFIIKNGKIEYEYVNPDYSQRLSPEILLALLKASVN